ncbi:MAG: hypothetical protein C5B47_01150, partial [Verrucomicrobia bacterium]
MKSGVKMSQSQESSQTSLSQLLPTPFYATKAPETIKLAVKDLVTFVPLDWMREKFSERSDPVELLCAEILQSHIPRISVAQLKNLLPHGLEIPAEIAPATKVLLPTARVALAYQLIIEKTAVASRSLGHHSSNPLSEAGSEERQTSRPRRKRRFFRILKWIGNQLGWSHKKLENDKPPRDRL